MAFYAAPGYQAYTAAKAGVVGLTRALAQELGPRGIRVNTVCPGFIDTALWDKASREVPDPEAYASQVARAHPLRRRGRPEDIAGPVAFLASSDAAFITGAALFVDGGLTTQLFQPLSGESTHDKLQQS
jgi:3alpha(or 20beta)-hydroxysteroid dehydrogenase/3-oxoacyl-[acyl-carrier protein] reductase